MILPIYLAWAARTPFSETAVARRLQKKRPRIFMWPILPIGK